MNETTPFKIYDPAMAARLAPLAYLILLEEARERHERAKDFVRHHPHIPRVTQLSVLSQEQIVLPLKKCAIPSRKRR
jgi:hypothetical protein